MLQRWALTLEYNGKAFLGSQIQCIAKSDFVRVNNPEIRTVQGELEKVLCTLIKKKQKQYFQAELMPA